MNIFNVILIRIIEGVLKFLLMRIYTGSKTAHRPVAPVDTQFTDRSISAIQSVMRNSEGHMESFQPIKYMLFIRIFNHPIRDDTRLETLFQFKSLFRLPTLRRLQ